MTGESSDAFTEDTVPVEVAFRIDFDRARTGRFGVGRRFTETSTPIVVPEPGFGDVVIGHVQHAVYDDGTESYSARQEPPFSSLREEVGDPPGPLRDADYRPREFRGLVDAAIALHAAYERSPITAAIRDTVTDRRAAAAGTGEREPVATGRGIEEIRALINSIPDGRLTDATVAEAGLSWDEVDAFVDAERWQAVDQAQDQAWLEDLAERAAVGDGDAARSLAWLTSPSSDAVGAVDAAAGVAGVGVEAVRSALRGLPPGPFTADDLAEVGVSVGEFDALAAMSEQPVGDGSSRGWELEEDAARQYGCPDAGADPARTDPWRAPAAAPAHGAPVREVDAELERARGLLRCLPDDRLVTDADLAEVGLTRELFDGACDAEETAAYQRAVEEFVVGTEREAVGPEQDGWLPAPDRGRAFVVAELNNAEREYRQVWSDLVEASTSRPSRTSRPAGESTAESIRLADAAVARIDEVCAAEDAVSEADRAEELARWHVADQAAETTVEHGRDREVTA